MMSEQTDQCSFLYDPRGFVRATINQGAQMELADAQEAVAATSRVAGGHRVPILVDVRGVVSETRECRQYFVGQEAEKVCEKVALWVSSPLSRIIASFFLRLTSQPMPTRVFGSDEEAIAWLLQPSNDGRKPGPDDE